MKILGQSNDGYFICQVHKYEIEKVFDKYYGKLPDGFLKVGEELNLGAGYDFRAGIQSACQAMVAATKDFERNQKTIFDFAQMVAKLPAKPDPEIDVPFLVERLVTAGRTMERLEDPSLKPMSEQDFRVYESARRTVSEITTKLKQALPSGDNNGKV